MAGKELLAEGVSRLVEDANKLGERCAWGGVCEASGGSAAWGGGRGEPGG